MAAIWSAAIFGIGRELRPGEPPKTSLMLFLGMGWLGVLVGAPLVGRLDGEGLTWLMMGAALYSAGTIFYRNPRGWRHAHGTWHLAPVRARRHALPLHHGDAVRSLAREACRPAR